MENEQKFGEYLTEKRKAKGFTLRGFATDINLSPEYVCNVEKGRKPAPANAVLEKIAKKLSLTPDEERTMYDLAAESMKKDKDIPRDVSEFIKGNKVVVAALRTAKDIDASDELWLEFIKKLESAKNDR